MERYKHLYKFNQLGEKTHRFCTVCEEFKLLQEFRIKDKEKGTLRYCCKFCENTTRVYDPKQKARMALYKAKHPYIKKNYSNIYINSCEITGTIFVSRSKNGNKNKILIKRQREMIREQRDNLYKLNANKTAECNCIECGNSFEYHTYISPAYRYKRKSIPKYCSTKCAGKYSRRISRVKRKALERSLFIENVDPIKVFNHSHWMCSYCGIDTPKELRGTYNDNAPELDHIIPLSKGGTHEYNNVQLLCRRCNAAKSDMILYSQNENNLIPNMGGISKKVDC